MPHAASLCIAGSTFARSAPPLLKQLRSPDQSSRQAPTTRPLPVQAGRLQHSRREAPLPHPTSSDERRGAVELWHHGVRAKEGWIHGRQCQCVGALQRQHLRDLLRCGLRARRPSPRPLQPAPLLSAVLCVALQAGAAVLALCLPCRRRSARRALAYLALALTIASHCIFAATAGLSLVSDPRDLFFGICFAESIVFLAAGDIMGFLALLREVGGDE